MKKVLLIVALTVSLGLLGSFFVAPASAFLPGLPGLGGGGGCSYGAAPCYWGWYGCWPGCYYPAPCVVKPKAKKAAPVKKEKK